ncbi:methyl-accepting chemotaxis protein [Aliikangiella coralliicola]|uniref:Methyl-accepting chemotaxis protein n=1 Tax=Aliikangiella coralliicola TaxID=2592383 RepID=A0A545UHX8_9GAMM|nr:methyl-accepting chemotaxis protein [Aliikangiella coralliicola]TQV89072.1 methyl-accepting chemotaxis protein [Aliikangiella coralliicola]
MKLKQKLVLGALSITIIPVVLVSVSLDTISFNAGRSSLEEQAKNQLVSVRDARKDQLETYLNSLQNQVKTFSNDLMIIEATKEFSSSFGKFREQADRNQPIDAQMLREYRENLSNYYTTDFVNEYTNRNIGEAPDMTKYLLPLDAESIALQYHYISANPESLGQKDNLTSAGDQSDYSKAHKKYHPHIRQYLKTFNYYDIFLVEPDTGDIIYSVFKELDYTTSLINGPYAETGLGRAFQKANRLTDPDGVVFEDFATYLPSYNDQAVFIASPIFDKGEKIGILVFQAPIATINQIMTVNQQWRDYGLGESGETYIVGSDNLIRNDSRFLIEDKDNYINALGNANLSKKIIDTIRAKNTSIGLQTVSTPGTQAAMLNKTGFDTFADYRGEQVLSAYTPLEFLGAKWAIMAEIDEAEAFAPTFSLRESIQNAAILIGLLVLALSGTIAWFLVKALVRPVKELEDTVIKVAEGDFGARAQVETDDELGTLSKTLNGLLDDRIAALAETERKNDELNESIIRLLEGTMLLSERDLTTKLPVSEDITGPLSDAIAQVVDAISDVLHEVNDIALTVEKSSNNVKSLSTVVSNSAETDFTQLEKSSQRLVKATGAMKKNAELATLCSDLTNNMSNMTNSAYGAVKNTIESMSDIRANIHETEKRIKRLGERSQEINNVVDIINNIAEKTHVLALNASMQAAAAGEEGRAFSVIADEVQRLAESARGATAQITSLVDNIQVETSDTSETMGNTISKVIEGASLVEKAGQEMEKTTNTATQLVEKVRLISDSCNTQSQVSDDLKNRSIKLQENARETQSKLELQSNETLKLVKNSEKLLESVQLFKLPERAKSANG